MKVFGTRPNKKRAKKPGRKIKFKNKNLVGIQGPLREIRKKFKNYEKFCQNSRIQTRFNPDTSKIKTDLQHWLWLVNNGFLNKKKVHTLIYF